MERLGNDLADGQPRVQRTERVLKDHLHLPAERASGGFAKAGHRLSAPNDAPGRDRRQPHDGSSRRRFSAARFADNCQSFPFVDVKANAVDGANHAPLPLPNRPVSHRKMNLQLIHLEQRQARVNVDDLRCLRFNVTHGAASG